VPKIFSPAIAKPLDSIVGDDHRSNGTSAKQICQKNSAFQETADRSRANSQGIADYN
jgi:hypothetical protein